MSSRGPAASGPGRRAVGTARIPFIRRCTVSLADGTRASASLVNLSVQGAYVSLDDPFARPGREAALPPDTPKMGQRLQVSFVPFEGSAPIAMEGRVSWLNPRQQHPVHSLPPGFGMQFQGMDPAAHRAIEDLVRTYLETHPEPR